MEKNLYVVYPDDNTGEYPYYKYSDELFDWFYSRLKYDADNLDEFHPLDIDLEQTRKDNNPYGCRIWLKNGCYIKFTESILLMEFTSAERKEMKEIQIDRSGDYLPIFGITLKSVVDYFYSIQNERKEKI
jgi:hypothetical protein